MSRKIDLMIIHCSDSDNKNHDDISIIDNWHKARGFKKVGYHYFIKKNGDIQTGRKEDEVGAHCSGYNQNSIGICLSGKKEFTEKQMISLKELCLKLLIKYSLTKQDILPHNAFNKNKTCPNFDVHKIAQELF